VNSCPPPAEREVKGFPRGLDLMALLGSIRAGEILKELGDTQYSDYKNKFFSSITFPYKLFFLGFGIKEPGQTLPGFVIVIFTFLLFRTNDQNFSVRYFDNIFPG